MSDLVVIAAPDESTRRGQWHRRAATPSYVNSVGVEN
jgi:hypothetical protein